MSAERLQPTCAACGSLREPVSLDWGGGMQRAYRCPDCGASWSVEGRQDALALELDGEELTLDYTN